ncbi:hypothetical protein AVAK2825_03205 [Acidovorax sp. SUPP2825]|nr:hypothetical protein AVAK2825_03205 [Acidovorax sp. SUPP2825]
MPFPLSGPHATLAALPSAAAGAHAAAKRAHRPVPPAPS